MSPSSWRDPALGVPGEVELAAGRLRYHEAGTGSVIVFVHGYLVNANIWRKLVPLLAQRYRCITPDWPFGSHVLPLHPDADLAPPGVARLIADFLAALDLRDVTLVGNDSGGAYSQIVAAHHPERLASLVLNSCETPDCAWPPAPGGFGLLKATAIHPATYRALYQVLRVRRTWRWPNTYGWLAKQPIDAPTMHSYIRPVLENAAIRRDGRKVIGSVSARYSRAAADHLIADFDQPILLAWAERDRVFPLGNARRYASRLRDAHLETIPDSYTYTAEDQPGHTARTLRVWMHDTARPSPTKGQT